MKKNILRLALLVLAVSIFTCACGTASTEEEIFDEQFVNENAAIDLNGFNMVYEFGSNTTDSSVDENVLGFMPNTMFADVARQRISDVEKKYNCTITVNYKDSYNSCRNFIACCTGGVFLCDAISGISDMWADAARTGMLVGMSEVTDYIDYKDEDKWGTRSLLEVVYYEDDLYGLIPFAWPELCHSSFGYPIVVNEDIINSLGETDPREYVENGEWTWDKFAEVLPRYTVVEGNTTKIYGIGTHNPYYAEMFLRSNGSSLVKQDANGNYVSGYTDERSMKAMQKAVDIRFGETQTCFDTKDDPEAVAEDFVNGLTTLSVTGTGYIYGQDARISLKIDNFGILKWPVGPDVDPSYSVSIMENNSYCIALSALSSAVENTAMIINDIYEPLDGFETFDDIKAYMEHNYFFDERDCETFFNMYLNQQYNYFHYGLRNYTVAYLTNKTSISATLEASEDQLQDLIDEDVIPSVNGIVALWGSFGD